ncbi:MAG: hypothetical protein ACE37B_15170 [Ilumatobacter sp.]|uniref:hypothetical protein n=1 Tax=Ilumatobacter sp. TaxID=1967498 RepID=UPI00391D0795
MTAVNGLAEEARTHAPTHPRRWNTVRTIANVGAFSFVAAAAAVTERTDGTARPARSPG